MNDNFQRSGNRLPSELREISFERDYTAFAAGSVLAKFGNTHVLCTASVDERVPGWLRNTGKGWVTAEYSLLPGSTQTRSQREAAKGKQSGRTQEIQRLIGRSLRSVVNMKNMPEVQLVLDCDVLQADGGTRTAAISGAYIAMHDAFERMIQNKLISESPILASAAAISVGVIDSEVFSDLDYLEDVRAEVDMNVVMNGNGEFIEVQGTAEGAPFSPTQLSQMLDNATNAISEVMRVQEKTMSAELPMRKISLG